MFDLSEIRADALEWKPDTDVKNGSLFLKDSSWWLRSSIESDAGTVPLGVRLTAKGIGSVVPCGGNEVFALAEGVKWFAVIRWPYDHAWGDSLYGSISLTEDGPVIWGQISYSNARCFGLDGSLRNPGRRVFEPQPRFPFWSAHIEMGPGDRFKLFDVEPESV